MRTFRTLSLLACLALGLLPGAEFAQDTVVVDINEQIAGKTALEQAAAQLAERLLPKLAQP